MDWQRCLQTKIFRPKFFSVHYQVPFTYFLNFSDFLVKMWAHKPHEKFWVQDSAYANSCHWAVTSKFRAPKIAEQPTCVTPIPAANKFLEFCCRFRPLPSFEEYYLEAICTIKGCERRNGVTFMLQQYVLTRCNCVHCDKSQLICILHLCPLMNLRCEYMNNVI